MKIGLMPILFAASLPTLAGTVIIDPSAFTAGSDVSNAYPGVTLATGQGTMQVYDTTVYQSLHLTSDLTMPVYTTGTRFAHAAGDIWTANNYNGCCGGDQVLRIDFGKSITSVAVQFYPDDTDTAVLQIYDRKGKLLAETYVRDSNAITLSLDAPPRSKIAYALATYADTGRIGAISISAPGKIK